MRERRSTAWRTTSRPATRALPASGTRSVVRMRTVVVLPAPLGPSRPSTVPAGTSRSPPESAWTAPKDLRRPLASMTGASATTDHASARTGVRGRARPESGANPRQGPRGAGEARRAGEQAHPDQADEAPPHALDAPAAVERQQGDRH